jgi:hypothetical protein
MVPDDEDAHTIAHNSKQEVIGEALEVDPPEVGFEEVVTPRTPGSVQHETTQFAIEVLGQFRVPGPLVLVHDVIYIGTNAPMKDELHDLRRRSMWESISRRVIACAGSASNSASRRSASATPSSSSKATGGKDWSRREARLARSFSVRRNASAAI